MITSDSFRASKMRGLNLSRVTSAEELKAKNIPAAKATGAGHGRIWVNATHDANDIYTTTPLEYIDQASLMGLPLIFTIEFQPRQGKCDWWGNERRKQGIINLWVQCAKRYKDNAGIIAYDLMNEPRRNPDLPGSNKEYIDFQIRIINAIRAVDPNKVIIVEVLKNQMLGEPKVNNVYTFTDMAEIVKIPNLVYSPHGYSTLGRDGSGGLRVTHQGVPPEDVRYKYPSTEFPSNLFSSNSYWNIPTQFAKKYNVPLWCGEFSCINWAPKNSANQWSSTRWIEDAIKYMNANGWSWAYHAWNEYEGWNPLISSEFYAKMNFVDAAPSPKPSYSEWKAGKSDTAPTITMLKKYFIL